MSWQQLSGIGIFNWILTCFILFSKMDGMKFFHDFSTLETCSSLQESTSTACRVIWGEIHPHEHSPLTPGAIFWNWIFKHSLTRVNVMFSGQKNGLFQGCPKTFVGLNFLSCCVPRFSQVQGLICHISHILLGWTLTSGFMFRCQFWWRKYLNSIWAAKYFAQDINCWLSYKDGGYLISFFIYPSCFKLLIKSSYWACWFV